MLWPHVNDDGLCVERAGLSIGQACDRALNFADRHELGRIKVVGVFYIVVPGIPVLCNYVMSLVPTRFERFLVLLIVRFFIVFAEGEPFKAFP